MTDRRDNKDIIEAIKEVKETLGNQINDLEKKIDDHIDKDGEWKEKVEKILELLSPVSNGIVAFQTIRGGAIYIAGFTTAVSAIVVGFAVAIKFLINTIK